MRNAKQQEYDEKQREIYEQGQRKVLDAAVALQRAKDLASDSTSIQEIDIDSSTAYFVNLSDLHIPEGDMYMLADMLKNLSCIPNIQFGFGGDQSQIEY